MPSGNPLTTPKIATPYCNYIDLQNIKNNVVFTTCIWYQIEVNQYIYIKVIHGIARIQSQYCKYNISIIAFHKFLLQKICIDKIENCPYIMNLSLNACQVHFKWYWRKIYCQKYVTLLKALDTLSAKTLSLTIWSLFIIS